MPKLLKPKVGQKSYAYIGTVNLGADYTEEQELFLRALETYKRVFRCPHPTCTQLLDLLRALGYERSGVPDMEMMQKLGITHRLTQTGPAPRPERAALPGPRR